MRLWLDAIFVRAGGFPGAGVLNFRDDRLEVGQTPERLRRRAVEPGNIFPPRSQEQSVSSWMQTEVRVILRRPGTIISGGAPISRDKSINSVYLNLDVDDFAAKLFPLCQPTPVFWWMLRSRNSISRIIEVENRPECLNYEHMLWQQDCPWPQARLKVLMVLSFRSC